MSGLGLERSTEHDGAPPSGPARIASELARLARVYGDERVLTISVRTSRRLVASLGRAHLSRAEVLLTEGLLGSCHLEEVVAHEVAHVVAWWRHGRVRPHGPHWKALVLEAGHTPRVTLDPRDFRLPPPRRRRRVRRRRVRQGFLWSLL